MNLLSKAKRIQVIAVLVEGVSINGTCRMTGVAKHPVLNLLCDIGCASAAYHHRHVRKPICCARCKSPFWDRRRRQAVKH
jgi:hypothetical protein